MTPPEDLATRPSSLPAEPYVSEQTFRGFFSTNQRAGRWEPADHLTVRAFCGEVTLDFTRAELPESGIVEIDALAFWGDIRIIVPDGAEVELEGHPFMGSVEQKIRKLGPGARIREWISGAREPEPDFEDDPSAEPPFFRIDARAIMGRVRVTGR